MKYLSHFGLGLGDVVEPLRGIRERMVFLEEIEEGVATPESAHETLESIPTFWEYVEEQNEELRKKVDDAFDKMNPDDTVESRKEAIDQVLRTVLMTLPTENPNTNTPEDLYPKTRAFYEELIGTYEKAKAIATRKQEFIEGPELTDALLHSDCLHEVKSIFDIPEEKKQYQPDLTPEVVEKAESSSINEYITLEDKTLEAWMRDPEKNGGYIFTLGKKGDAVRVFQKKGGKMEYKSTIPTGIKKIWAIRNEDGSIRGFATLDGQGHMASREKEAMRVTLLDVKNISQHHTSVIGDETKVQNAAFVTKMEITEEGEAESGKKKVLRQSSVEKTWIATINGTNDSVESVDELLKKLDKEEISKDKKTFAEILSSLPEKLQQEIEEAKTKLKENIFPYSWYNLILEKVRAYSGSERVQETATDINKRIITTIETTPPAPTISTRHSDTTTPKTTADAPLPPDSTPAIDSDLHQARTDIASVINAVIEKKVSVAWETFVQKYNGGDLVEFSSDPEQRITETNFGSWSPELAEDLKTIVTEPGAGELLEAMKMEDNANQYVQIENGNITVIGASIHQIPPSFRGHHVFYLSAYLHTPLGLDEFPSLATLYIMLDPEIGFEEININDGSYEVGGVPITAENKHEYEYVERVIRKKKDGEGKAPSPKDPSTVENPVAEATSDDKEVLPDGGFMAPEGDPSETLSYDPAKFSQEFKERIGMKDPVKTPSPDTFSTPIYLNGIVLNPDEIAYLRCIPTLSISAKDWEECPKELTNLTRLTGESLKRIPTELKNLTELHAENLSEAVCFRDFPKLEWLLIKPEIQITHGEMGIAAHRASPPASQKIIGARVREDNGSITTIDAINRNEFAYSNGYIVRVTEKTTTPKSDPTAPPSAPKKRKGVFARINDFALEKLGVGYTGIEGLKVKLEKAKPLSPEEQATSDAWKKLEEMKKGSSRMFELGTPNRGKRNISTSVGEWSQNLGIAVAFAVSPDNTSGIMKLVQSMGEEKGQQLEVTAGKIVGVRTLSDHIPSEFDGQNVESLWALNISAENAVDLDRFPNLRQIAISTIEKGSEFRFNDLDKITLADGEKLDRKKFTYVYVGGKVRKTGERALETSAPTPKVDTKKEAGTKGSVAASTALPVVGGKIKTDEDPAYLEDHKRLGKAWADLKKIHQEHADWFYGTLDFEHKTFSTSSGEWNSTLVKTLKNIFKENREVGKLLETMEENNGNHQWIAVKDGVVTGLGTQAQVIPAEFVSEGRTSLVNIYAPNLDKSSALQLDWFTNLQDIGIVEKEASSWKKIERRGEKIFVNGEDVTERQFYYKGGLHSRPEVVTPTRGEVGSSSFLGKAASSGAVETTTNPSLELAHSQALDILKKVKESLEGEIGQENRELKQGILASVFATLEAGIMAPNPTFPDFDGLKSLAIEEAKKRVNILKRAFVAEKIEKFFSAREDIKEQYQQARKILIEAVSATPPKKA